MKPMEKMFNQYLSNLVVFTYKLHNVHWNVVGAQFHPIHIFTEGEYDKAFERTDEIAEHMRMFGYIPAASLKQFMEFATLQEVEPKLFASEEGLKIVFEDLKALREEAIALRKACDEEGYFAAVSLLEDHIADYNKQIWFVGATLHDCLKK